MGKKYSLFIMLFFSMIGWSQVQNRIQWSWPQCRNANGSVTPEVSSSSIYLGDNVTFGFESWGMVDGKKGKSEAVISKNPDLSTSALYGSWTGYTDKEYKQVVSPRFSSTGEWYWGAKVEYTDAGGTTGWYCKNNSSWYNMWGTPTSNLTLTVNPLNTPSPATPSAVSGSQINLGWSKDAQNHNVMIVRSTTNTFTAPTQGTAYSVGATIGSGTVIYNSDGTAFSDTGLACNTTYYYAFYSENNSYYSTAVTAYALTLSSVPSITTQPSSASSCTTGTATFTVAASGSGLSYQWQEFTSAWNTISNGGVYSGANTNSLTITNPTSGMNGYKYRAVVTGTCSPTSTNTDGNATLTVNASAAISVQPSVASATYCAGSAITPLSVTASGSNIGYQWYSNTTASNSGGTLISGATSSSYTPDNSVFSKKYYYVVVSNAGCSPITSNVSGSVTVTTPGVWLGTTNTDWNTASNWCGGIPTNTTDVVIPSTATNMPTVSANAVAKSVTINSGATLNGGTGNLTLSGNFTNNGTFNPDTGTITVSNTGTSFSASTSPYTFYNLVLNGAATFSAQPTINNILNIKAGGNIKGSSPIYASGSTLKYNTGGNFGISSEWTSANTPYHVTIGDEVNNSELNFSNISDARQLNGNLTIGTGSNTAKLTLSTKPGGDLKIGGNFTEGASGSTINKERAVFFTGAVGNQIVTKSGGGTIYFDYLFVDKNVGDLQLSGTTGQKTNLQINSIGAANVYQLELINGSIDLNGQMFTMNATKSTGYTENTTNIKISGTGARRIYTSTGSGDFVFAGNYTAGKSNAKFNFAPSATLTFDTNVTLQTSVGLDFGTNGSTLINSILQINQKGFVIGHSPDYGNYSTLIYNNGSNGFFRNMEWNSNSGAGYPNNVIVRGSNNTLVELDGESPIGFPVPNDLGCSGNLTVESGATLKFNKMNYDLYVAGNVNLSGSLQQSAMAGADLFVNGNWEQSGTGVLTGNNRTVVFNKQSSSIAQTISGSTTFDNITLNNSAGLNCIGATDNNTVNQNLTLTNGKITLNTNNLIIGASGNITNYSDTRYIVTNNTGELKRTLETDKYYPVGSETAYNPIKLSNNGTTDVYGIRTIYGDITDAKNLSDPYDYFDSNAVLKLKWQITEAVSGGQYPYTRTRMEFYRSRF